MTDTQKDRTDSITSTANMGGNNLLIMKINRIGSTRCTYTESKLYLSSQILSN